MPLIFLAVTAYAVGLLAGFAGEAVAAAWAIVGVIAIAARRRSLTVAALGLLTLAGLCVAAATSIRDAQCARTLASSALWRARLSDDARPGAVVHAVALECRASLILMIEDGEGFTGSTVNVHGVGAATPHGLLVQHAAIRVEREPGLLDRWRARTTAAIDRIFGADAPLVRALVVADRRRLDPELRDRYAAAGLAHMLAISGLHIGLIALALGIALQLLRQPPERRAAVALLVVATYIAAIGAPAGAVRAAVMLGVHAVTRAVQRRASPWAILAIGAAGPLVDPRTVMEFGYQLSVIGVASLICAATLTRRLPMPRLGWVRSVAVGLLGSSIATAACAPLVAWTLGRVSVVGPLTTLLATPCLVVAQPMLFTALLLAPFHPAASFVADAAHPLLVAFDWIATTGAAVPFGRLELAPTPLAALIGGTCSLALLTACASKSPARPLTVVVAGVAGLVWLPLTPNGSGLVELHMIDVGQGDAIALRTPRGHWVLFDAGGSWPGGDAGRQTVIPYLARRGGPLDAFILSHPHTDHVGGGASVIRAFRPPSYFDAAFAAGTEAYFQSLVVARRTNTRWRRVHPGDSLVVDGVALTFLGPDSSWTASLTDPNLASTIVRVRVGDVHFLLVGDAEQAEEDWLLAHGAPLRADVLKVGHHGSATSSTAAFLDAVRPAVALISVGAGNRYGHPSPTVVHALLARRVQVLRTDLSGSVVVRTDGHWLSVEINGDTWRIPPSSTPS